MKGSSPPAPRPCQAPTPALSLEHCTKPPLTHWAFRPLFKGAVLMLPGFVISVLHRHWSLSAPWAIPTETRSIRLPWGPCTRIAEGLEEKTLTSHHCQSRNTQDLCSALCPWLTLCLSTGHLVALS